jgi:ATP/maltotriose-dependent transcriptional regulator MalT
MGVARAQMVAASHADGSPPDSEPGGASMLGPVTLSEHQWIEALTAREAEILHLINAGLTNQEIADQLVIALGTVKRHTANIYGKLGVRSRTQAIVQARRCNLL